jgi:hypothetical protein
VPDRVHRAERLDRRLDRRAARAAARAADLPAVDGGQVGGGGDVVASRPTVLHGTGTEDAQLKAARPGVHHEDALRRAGIGVGRSRSG